MVERFDYVIVGAGSAGCVIANRLTEDPNVTVLLLEAGGRDRQFFYRLALGFHSWRYPETNWSYLAEPDPTLADRRLPVPGLEAYRDQGGKHCALISPVGRPAGRKEALNAFFAAIPTVLRHQGDEAYYRPVADRVYRKRDRA